MGRKTSSHIYNVEFSISFSKRRHRSDLNWRNIRGRNSRPPSEFRWSIVVVALLFSSGADVRVRLLDLIETAFRMFPDTLAFLPVLRCFSALATAPF